MKFKRRDEVSFNLCFKIFSPGNRKCSNRIQLMAERSPGSAHYKKRKKIKIKRSWLERVGQKRLSKHRAKKKNKSWQSARILSLTHLQTKCSSQGMITTFKKEKSDTRTWQSTNIISSTCDGVRQTLSTVRRVVNKRKTAQRKWNKNLHLPEVEVEDQEVVVEVPAGSRRADGDRNYYRCLHRGRYSLQVDHWIWRRKRKEILQINKKNGKT